MTFLDGWAGAAGRLWWCVFFVHFALVARADCTVEQKILRDGIVGVPLPAGMSGGLTLSAVGKIRDSQLQDRYSVWQISNPGSGNLRVVLQDVASDYRIPILARAGMATLVRSDRATGMVTHQLVVAGSIVNTALGGDREFSNDTMLDDVACALEGNPLYVAEQLGSLKLSTMHGATLAEISSAVPVTALVTEQPGGDLWMLANDVLRSFATSGELRHTVTVPADASNAQHLIVEGGTSVWLARGSTLYRLGLPDGALLGSVTYTEPIRELTHDVRTGRVWVLLESMVRIVRAGNSPAIEDVANLTLAGSGRAMAYDPFWSETWVGTVSSLTRHGANGNVSFEAPIDSIVPMDHLVADGAGGAWGASGAMLLHWNVSGGIDVQLQPFQGLPDSVVAIAADPADGSVWAASRTRIRNFSRQQSLLQDVQPTLADSVIRQLSKLELFADRSPPRVWISAPSDGAVVSTRRPSINVQYDAEDVAPATIEVRMAEQHLLVSCAPHASGASCTLNEDLPEGEITVSPSAYDLAGNEAIPTPRTFTVASSSPPSVWIYEPEDLGSYNQAQITFFGGLSHPASVTINGVPVSVNGQTLEFTHDVTLQEGPNVFTIVAENSGGRREFEMMVTLDTVPPPPAIISSISVTAPSEYELRIEGAAGSIEPYARIRIHNRSRGDWTDTTAQEDGSFSAILLGQFGDELFVTVTDAADNQASTGEQQIDNSGLIPALFVDGPTNSTTDSHVTIRGWVAGALDTGVTVNGIAATIVDGHLVREFRARVPLTPGMNFITVIAKRHQGVEAVRTVQVERVGVPPFSVIASPTEGIAPLDVVFTIERQVGDRIVRVEIDFDGDGVREVTQTTMKTRFEHRYAQPGSYTASVRIVYQPNASQANQTYVATVPIGVMTIPAADGQIRSVWQRFKQALADGDSVTALQYMTSQAAEQYQPIFAQLQGQLPAIAASFSVPELAQFLPGMAEYIVRRPVGTTEQAFLIYFRRAPDGTWRVAGM